MVSTRSRKTTQRRSTSRPSTSRNRSGRRRLSSCYRPNRASPNTRALCTSSQMAGQAVHRLLSVDASGMVRVPPAAPRLPFSFHLCLSISAAAVLMRHGLSGGVSGESIGGAGSSLFSSAPPALPRCLFPPSLIPASAPPPPTALWRCCALCVVVCVALSCVPLLVVAVVVSVPLLSFGWTAAPLLAVRSLLSMGTKAQKGDTQHHRSSCPAALAHPPRLVFAGACADATLRSSLVALGFPLIK